MFKKWYHDSDLSVEMDRDGVGPGVVVWIEIKSAEGATKVLHVLIAFMRNVSNSVVQRVTAMNGDRVILRAACSFDGCNKIMDSTHALECARVLG